MVDIANPTEAKAAVIEPYTDYLSEFGDETWPWEITRWYELVFCLLNAFAEQGRVESDIRFLAESLAGIGMLEIEALAAVSAEDQDADSPSDVSVVTLRTLLQNASFSPEQAKSAVAAICEAARSLHTLHRGKIQRCLRKHGEAMLNEWDREFAISDHCISRHALVLWLQHVLNLPVPQSTPFLAGASKDLGFTYEQALETADEKNPNVALMDDALRLYSMCDWAEPDDTSETERASAA